jgi:hypothetical protein
MRWAAYVARNGKREVLAAEPEGKGLLRRSGHR